MTEQQGFAEPAPPATVHYSDGLPGTGPVAEDPRPAGSVTVASGAAAAEPEPAETAAPVPSVDADPQEVAEEAAAAEPEQAVSSTVPEPLPPPFIPDVGVAPWLKDALTWLHERVTNLEG